MKANCVRGSGSICSELMLILIVIVFTHTTQAQQTEKVLFIGNSYTAVNSLPSLTAALALSAGDTLIHSQHTPGGNTLAQHSQNPTALALIASDNWDHVVLQAQSQEPSFPIAQVEEQTFPFAESLCESIRENNSCTRPMFYMTWGRENGDASNCEFWPPVCTYEGMDDLLKERYELMGEINEAYVSPVGTVWRNIRENHPEINLYSADGSHPSIRGSYLAACTFYSIIFEADPLSITSDHTLSAENALAIRQATHDLAYSNLEGWNVGQFDPVANFSYQVDGLSITFTDNSQYGMTGMWYFGDGSTSTLDIVTHDYSVGGVYQIMRIIDACGISDSLTIEIEISAGMGIDSHTQNELLISPNPTQRKIMITSAKPLVMVRIYSLEGKLMLTSRESTIVVESLRAGEYLLEAHYADGKIARHFHKE